MDTLAAHISLRLALLRNVMMRMTYRRLATLYNYRDMSVAPLSLNENQVEEKNELHIPIRLQNLSNRSNLPSVRSLKTNESGAEPLL